MIVYDEFRDEILASLEQYEQYYRNKKEAIPWERVINIKDLREIIARHDSQRKAYELRQEVKYYVKDLTFRIFNCWVPVFSVTHFQSVVLEVLRRPENRDHQINLRVRNEYQAKLELRETRASSVVETRCKTLKKQLKETEYDLSQATKENKRLHDENDFLTEQLEKIHVQQQPPVLAPSMELIPKVAYQQYSLWSEMTKQQRQVKMPEQILAGSVVK